MFEIGFTEILLIAVITLVVFGPEKLPTIARTAGLWVARFKRMANDVKSELERELDVSDIKQTIHNESIMSAYKEGQEAARNFQKLPYDVSNIINTPSAPAPAEPKNE